LSLEFFSWCLESRRWKGTGIRQVSLINLIFSFDRHWKVTISNCFWRSEVFCCLIDRITSDIKCWLNSRYIESFRQLSYVWLCWRWLDRTMRSFQLIQVAQLLTASCVNTSPLLMRIWRAIFLHVLWNQSRLVMLRSARSNLSLLFELNFFNIEYPFLQQQILELLFLARFFKILFYLFWSHFFCKVPIVERKSVLLMT